MASQKGNVVESAKVDPTTTTDKIQILAYQKWLAKTGGQTLADDPEGVQFWLEAEREVLAERTDQ